MGAYQSDRVDAVRLEGQSHWPLLNVGTFNLELKHGAIAS